MIKKLFGFATSGEATRIVVNCEPLETRVALLENKTLEEYTIERKGSSNIVGSIFKGRVKNSEQGLKAMFVDIGLDKNAFLHFWDAIPAALDSGTEEIRRNSRKKRKRPVTRPALVTKVSNRPTHPGSRLFDKNGEGVSNGFAGIGGLG